MRRFELIDGERAGAIPCGLLRYDPSKQEFAFEAAPDAGPLDVPMMFAPFIEAGEREVPARWVRAWVDERIAPPSRQNIGEILRAHDLSEYDPCELLTSGEGRSTQDGFYLREIGDGYRGAVELGRALLRARETCGMTQEELARRAGISQEVISKLERGGSNPTMRTLERLARAMDMCLIIKFDRPEAGPTD